MSPEALRCFAEAARALAKGLDELASKNAQAEPVAVEGYLGTAEAARRLGVTPDTITAWIAKDRLRASKLPGGRGWRMTRLDLDAALANTGGVPHDSKPIDLQTRARALAASVTAKRGPRR